MYNVLKHETTEDVKQEVLRTLKKDNWKEILCTTPNGTYLNPYQNAKTIVASAKMAPIGVFESEVFCDNMLRQAIIENIDDIARFVIKGVPMKIFVTEYEEDVGFVAQAISDTQIIKTTTYKTALYISKHKDSEAGFYISMFTPVL